AIDRARERGLVAGALSPGDILRMPQALSVRDRPVEVDPAAGAQLATSVEAAIEQAIADLDGMRVREGDHLRADLDARKHVVGIHVEQLARAADEGRSQLQARLQERVREM